eukprot:4801302-Amphidinium_carterae.2
MHGFGVVPLQPSCLDASCRSWRVLSELRVRAAKDNQALSLPPLHNKFSTDKYILYARTYNREAHGQATPFVFVELQI